MVPLGEIILIHELYRQGMSISAIAAQVGVDRKTVRRHITRGIEPPAYKLRSTKPRLIEPFEDYIRDRLRQFPTLSAKRLLREITDRGYNGKYIGVKLFVASVKPAKSSRFEVRLMAICTQCPTAPNGRKLKFRAILTASTSMKMVS